METSKTALAPPRALAPATHPDRVWARQRALSLRAWTLTALLFLIPLVAYWPATFHDYGLRDDYSNLREAHEEPATVMRFCASHARPIYGWLLQATYGQTDSVKNLEWTRVLASLLLGAISLVSFRSLRALGWSFNTSLSFAVLVVLVPSAQVIAGWAVGWPYAAAALLAVGGFFAAEGATARAITLQLRIAQGFVGLGLMVVSALIYQPSAMFYLVPLAAALIAQRERNLAQTSRWIAFHCGFVGVSLAIAYGIISAMYAAGLFVKSGRVAFETDWVGKLQWFINEPLPNALSLFVLNDDHQRDHVLYAGCASLVAAILAAGVAVEWKRHGHVRGLIWLTGLLGLPLFACAVSLIASERYATYRTIYAMTAVLLCFLVASVRALTHGWGSRGRALLAASCISIAFFIAQHHVYALIAVPQGNEWDLIENGAMKVRIDSKPHADRPRPRIFAIASTPADISTATIYHDEFGSLSSNSEWVPKEMFKRAMHDLHPGIVNLESRYEFATGVKLPAGQHYDVIIDMRKLRRYFVNN
jgi:hypothetical protein